MSGVADGARELSVSSQKVSKILREAGKEMVPGNSFNRTGISLAIDRGARFGTGVRRDGAATGFRTLLYH